MIRKYELSILKKDTIKSEYGTTSTTWTEEGKMSGVLYAMSTSEKEIADKVVQDSTHIFISNEIDNIKSGDRVRVMGKLFEVNFVDNVGYLDRHLEIELKEILEQVNVSQLHRYIGVLNQSVVNTIDLQKLKSEIVDSKSFTKNIEFDKDGNLFIIYPKDFGNSAIRLNNQLITNWTITEMNISGNSYYVYSRQIEKGNYKIELY